MSSPPPAAGATILHMIDSGGLYGAERVLLTLSAESRRQGYRVVVSPIVAPEDDGDPLGEAAEAAGIEVQRFGLADGVRLEALGRIVAHVRAQRAHVVHCHGYKANILFGLLGRARRPCPTVGTLHGWTARRPLSRMGAYEALERRLVGRLDHVVAVSSTIAARLPGKALRARTEIIPNGVETALPGGAERVPAALVDFLRGKGATVLAAGRLSAEKGFDILLRAMRGVVDRIPSARLVIAGEGPERPGLEALAVELGLTGHVALPGYLPDVRRLMPHFSVFALSSLTEGLPTIVIEAMAEGVPVVATAVGAVPEVLQGGCGRVVPPGDAAALSGRLCELLNDGAARRAVSARALQRFHDHYSSARMANRYHSLYETLRAAKGIR